MEGVEEMKQPLIASVEPVNDTTIRVSWRDGSITLIDLAQTIDELPGIAALKDPQKFRDVAVGLWGHSVSWNEEIDMGADTLWRMAKEQSGDYLPVHEFRDWRRRNGLSLSAAAKCLGLSRRMVVYYDTGEKPIPRLVGLACRGYEAQKQAA